MVVYQSILCIYQLLFIIHQLMDLGLMTSMVTEVLGIINNAVVDNHVQEFVLCFYNKFVCVCVVCYVA